MEVGVILGCLRSVCVSGEDWLEELEEPPVPHLGLQMKTSPPPQLPIPPYHLENSWCVKLNSCAISQDEEYTEDWRIHNMEKLEEPHLNTLLNPFLVHACRQTRKHTLQTQANGVSVFLEQRL